MKKLIFHIFSILVAMILSQSCHRLFPETPLTSGQEISISISTPGDEIVISTKADVTGSEAHNENLIASIDYFIWPDDATDSNPILSGHYEDASPSQLRKTIRVGVNEEEADLLFPGDRRTCTIFVIVNCPESVNLSALSTKSLNNIKAQSFTSNFGGNSPNFTIQERFVMTHQGQITLDSKRKQTIARATLPLKRVAACISTSVSIPNAEYTDQVNNKTYTAQPSTMTVRLYNCASRANLASNPGILVSADYFDYSQRRAFSGPVGGLYDSGKFYTYPLSWTQGSQHEPYLIISLNWKDNETGTSTPYFYKVILDGNSLESNRWHHIKFIIGMLGSMSEDSPTVLVPALTYYVDDWKSSIFEDPNGGSSGGGTGVSDPSFDVDAEISEARYLVLSRKTYVLNNQNSLTIPFGSSHDCRLGAVYDSSIYGQFFNDGDTTKTIYAAKENFINDSVTPVDATSWLNVNMNTHMIEFNHVLNNDLSSGNYDYAPFTLRFRIQHRGDNYYQNYYEEICIIQYPAMFIAAELSGVGSGREGTYGYMMINGGRDSQTNENLGGIHGIGGNNVGNKNRHMYIITTTVLPDGSPYMLADPRETEINNLGNWYDPSNAYAPGVEGGGYRQLRYYYPARTSSEGTNYLAPKFRIASSYGVTYPVTFENAQKRCAAYQEDGYPAGRWRLPTIAEIKYMCQLTTDKYIPRLLGTNTDNEVSNYWAGNGHVTVYGGDTTMQPQEHVGITTDEYSVRCVYDEWYWEESQYPTVDKDTFTWGDQPRYGANY